MSTPHVYRGATLWLTGLPAAGKTTLSRAVAERLLNAGYAFYVLDGDVLREGLCADLGFDTDSRKENIRRASYVACMLAETGVMVIAALISPYESDRAFARDVHRADGLGFMEVFLDTPLAECERRDPKGLYARARRGEITGMTGIDDAYEPPHDPDLVVHAGRESVSECAENVIEMLLGTDHLARVRPYGP